MLAGNDMLEPFDDVRMLSCEVVVFVDILRQVVEMAYALVYIQFPVTLTYSHLVCFVEFPVEEVMFFLLSRLSEQGRCKRNTVEGIIFQLVVSVSLLEIPDADEVAESGYDVIKCQLVVTGLTRFDVTGPTYYEGDTDAALVAGAFDSAEFAITAEESRVCATLFVRTVVR